MSRAATLAVLSLMLAACGEALPPPPPDGGLPPPADGGTPPPVDAGQPLVTLGGPLVLDTGTLTPADLRVGVLWFPSADTAAPERPRAAESARTAMTNPYPARWQLALFDAPPADARAAFTTPGGGSGFRSIGAVVLFRDRDGDGQLTLDGQGDSADELYGSSAGVMPFDVDGPGLRHLLVWRSGTLGTDEAGYQLGFNLVSIDEPFATPVVKPLTTELPLTASIDGRHALTFCEEAYALEPRELACGHLLFRTPRVTALIGESEGVLFAGIQVHSGERAIGNARVRLNGVDVPSDGESGYMLIELSRTVIREGLNSVRVEAPGLEPTKAEVVLPAAPSFVTPSSNATVTTGSQLEVTWTGAELADTFDVSLTGDNGMADFVTTSERRASVKAPETAGPAVLRLTSSAERRLGRHLGFGSVEIARDVQVVTP